MGIGKIIRDGLPFSNVVATGTATANITPGRTLEKITLKLGGTTFTKAMITRLVVKANGKAIMDTTGTILDKLNAYRGIAQDAAYLDIHFADFGLNNEFDRMVSAFDTSSGASLPGNGERGLKQPFKKATTQYKLLRSPATGSVD